MHNRSLDLLTSSQARYHCVTDAPKLGLVLEGICHVVILDYIKDMPDHMANVYITWWVSSLFVCRSRRYTSVCPVLITSQTGYNLAVDTSGKVYGTRTATDEYGKWNHWCYRPRFCTVMLYWAGDNLGERDEFCYESCPWCRLDRMTWWSAVQHATTLLRMPTQQILQDIFANADACSRGCMVRTNTDLQLVDDSVWILSVYYYTMNSSVSQCQYR